MNFLCFASPWRYVLLLNSVLCQITFGAKLVLKNRRFDSSPPLVASVFLFLLGHTHNLLRSVLHAVFAQQIHGITWRGNELDLNGGGGGGNRRVLFKVD